MGSKDCEEEFFCIARLVVNFVVVSAQLPSGRSSVVLQVDVLDWSGFGPSFDVEPAPMQARIMGSIHRVPNPPQVRNFIFSGVSIKWKTPGGEPRIFLVLGVEGDCVSCMALWY